MNDEIAEGIKIAIERGESLEEAIQSFINAGYNPNEVREAANSLTDGAAIPLISEIPENKLSEISSPQKNLNEIPKENKKKIIWIILIFILLILILTIIISLVFFKPELTKFINNFFK